MISSCTNLTAVLRDVVRDILWMHDQEIELQAPDRLAGRWSTHWVKEMLWTLAESFGALSKWDDKIQLKVRPNLGWVQMDFEISGNPFTREEKVALTNYANEGKSLRKPPLAEAVDHLRALAVGQGGLIFFRIFSKESFTISVTLPQGTEAFAATGT